LDWIEQPQLIIKFGLAHGGTIGRQQFVQVILLVPQIKLGNP
jgi:hypothetical protein